VIRVRCIVVIFKRRMVKLDEKLKMVREETSIKESDNNNSLSVKEIINRLVPILEMTPLEEEEALNDLVEESGKRLATIRKQLSFMKKEKNNENKKINEILMDDDIKKNDISIREQVLSLMHRKEFGQASELLVEEIENRNYIYTTKVDKGRRGLHI